MTQQLPRHAEVVVIGGGIVGAASAYFMAKRDISVVLLERGPIGGEQSSRNWGFVRQQGRHPVELPLAIESNRLWLNLEAELQADIEWTQGGNLALAFDGDRLDQYASWIEEVRGHGLETRLLTADETREVVPGLEGQLAGAMYTPTDGHADPTKTTNAFSEAAAREGAIVISGCAVDEIMTTDSDISGVSTEGGYVETKQVVCAAGAWSERLLRNIGLKLPQRLVRATVQRTTPVPPITQAGVWAGDISFRQRRDGRVILAGGGADHDLTLASLRDLRRFLPNFRQNRSLFRLHLGRPLLRDLIDALGIGARRQHPFRIHFALPTEPNRRVAIRALEHFRKIFPGVSEIQSEEQWAGVIDATPDAVPVIDAVDHPQGLLVATGFSGHGFAMGPIAGRLVSEMIVDGTPSLNLEGFRFDRFTKGALAEPRSVL